MARELRRVCDLPTADTGLEGAGRGSTREDGKSTRDGGVDKRGGDVTSEIDAIGEINEMSAIPTLQPRTKKQTTFQTKYSCVTLRYRL